MRRLTLLACVAVAALLGLAVWGCFGFAHHLIVAIDKWGDSGEALNATLVQVNQPCKTIKGQKLSVLGLKDCGLLASFESSLRTFRGTMGVVETVAHHEEKELTKWDTRGEQLFDNVNGGVTDLRETIRKTGDAAKQFGGSADAATKLVDELRTKAADEKDGMGAVLKNANGTISDLRSLTPDVKRATKAGANAVEEVNGIAGDGHKIADHYEQATDNPKKNPWYIRILPTAVRMIVQAWLTHMAVN
jgi:hypothetical protein